MWIKERFSNMIPFIVGMIVVFSFVYLIRYLLDKENLDDLNMEDYI